MLLKKRTQSGVYILIPLQGYTYYSLADMTNINRKAVILIEKNLDKIEVALLYFTLPHL
jgi:hypothetical protein